MEAYESYQEMFDGKMDGFFEKKGISEQDFVDECQKALLSPFGDDALFVNNVLAATSYEAFVGMIVASHNRQQLAEQKDQDSKIEISDQKAETKSVESQPTLDSKDERCDEK
jgi:hypothetical protein